MIRVRGEGTRRGLELLAAGVVQAANLALKGAMIAARESARATSEFRDRTGETRGSIQAKLLGGGRGLVEARGAARFLEDGTKRHWIGSAVLIPPWRYIGWHPGTKARPFMRQARERGEIAARYGAEFYVAEAIRRAR